MRDDDDQRALNTWEDHAEHNEERSRQDQARQQFEEEINPQRKCLHQCFVLVNAITVTTALLMIIAQVLGMYFKELSLVDYVVRFYMIGLCMTVVLNELEWTSMVKDSQLLQNWITRGLVYAFIGILGIEQFQASPEFRGHSNDEDDGDDDSETGNPFNAAALRFIWIISNVMVGVGCLYVVMGVCCMQIISRRLRTDYDERLVHATHARQVTAPPQMV
eukprot:CAMPEP_0119551090 /NCGR_PEP_ID=MMETSP1352-20130426/4454_1 /TAXON_ID=265584 /ORGANISM="Stauroneis constricta, Strain CCMP1120" /LENGTH=218 /DNA_ID=CAMNT_0007597099 /DNA_START=162 /DNA_END=818 /DNA_ORIENTATION=+